MTTLKSLILLFFLLILSCGSNDENKQTQAEFTSEHNQMLANNKERVKAILSDDFAFTGLEFIYVDFGKIYYSWWGHALIRFVGSGESPDQDWTLSFIADFNDYELDNLKAYFGGYEVLTIMKPLKDYMDEYIQGESRQMLRYPIVATKENQLKFLNIIRSWIKDTTLAGPYTFRSNNCSGLMMKSLYESGISTIDNYETYPFDMPIQFHQANLVYLPPHELTYSQNAVMDESLYLPCEKDCSEYKRKAGQYYSQEKIDEFYDFDKMKSKKSLDLYLVRLVWWAKKLSALLND